MKRDEAHKHQTNGKKKIKNTYEGQEEIIFSETGGEDGGCFLSPMDQYQPISSQSQASDNDGQEMMSEQPREGGDDRVRSGVHGGSCLNLHQRRD